MILSITHMERGVRKTSKGSEQTGLLLTGMKKGYQGAPDEEYEKFIFDWCDAESIEKIEEFNVGDDIELVMEKDGKFWNIGDVVAYGGGSTGGKKKPASGKREDGPLPDGNPTKTEVITPYTTVEMPAPNMKVLALDAAVKVMVPMITEGVLKKVSMDLILQTTKGMADDLEGYLKAGTSAVTSDTKDLAAKEAAVKPEIVSEGEEAIPEDDIPF